jgi:phosphatidylglycerophosphate synthase
MEGDFAASIALVACVAGSAIAYGVRVASHGHARSARVESAGASAFLGRAPMEMAYWALTPLGGALVSLGVTANAVTAASLVFGLGAGVALGLGHFGIGALLSAISALGDALDGYVARASGTASDSGETYDAAVDRYNEFFFLGAAAIVYRQSALWLAVVLAALAGSFMVSYSTAKAEALQVEPPRGAMRRAERAVYLTVACGLVPLVGAVSSRFADAPFLIAVSLVAVVANVSSVCRLAGIAELVKARDRRSSEATAAIREKAGEAVEVEKPAKLRSAVSS